MRLFAWGPIALIALAGCSSDHQTSPQPEAQPAKSEAAPKAPIAPAAQLLPGQPSYSSPEEAMQALYRASSEQDLKQIARIVGLPEDQIAGADSASTAQCAAFFAKAHDEYSKIVRDGDSRARIFIGKDNYPLASPLVKVDGRWFFDSAGGKEALVCRVIGENELATIGVCRTYVQAQYEYYAEDRNGDDVLEYAQKLGSTRGEHDGLYWHTDPGQAESPLGPLIADARATGYLHGSVRALDEAAKPYHGYLFQILTAQGPSAPGGQHDYIINGHMVAGFALVAYPAKWNVSGVVTFLVGANGKVYQKNLGENTAEMAGSMTEYNPDSTWTLVQE